MKFRTNYTERPAGIAGISFEADKKLTKDSFKDDCDINRIVDRYARTGELPRTNPIQAQYGDVSNLPESYLEAVNLVTQAEQTFGALPAAVRAECGNSPALFLERIKDPEFVKKHKLGATPLPAAPEPVTGKAEASNPPSAKEKEAPKA